MTEEKQKFIELLAESGAVQFGDFTAKSGRKTPFLHQYRQTDVR